MKKYNYFKNHILGYTKDIFVSNQNASNIPQNAPILGNSNKFEVDLATPGKKVDELVDEINKRLGKTAAGIETNKWKTELEKKIQVNTTRIENLESENSKLRADLNNLGNKFNQLVNQVNENWDGLMQMNEGLINKNDEQDKEIQELRGLIQDLVDGKIGASGKDGKSAFEVWLINNPGKTKEQFFESIKGENGKDGIDGKDGKDGKNGDSLFPDPPKPPENQLLDPTQIKYVEVVGKGKIDINDFTLINSHAQREALRKELKTYNGINKTADRIIAYMEWCSKQSPQHTTYYLDDLIYWTGNEIKSSDPKKRKHPVNRQQFIDSDGKSHYYRTKITTAIIPGLTLALKTKPIPSTGKQGTPKKKNIKQTEYDK